MQTLNNSMVTNAAATGGQPRPQPVVAGTAQPRPQVKVINTPNGQRQVVAASTQVLPNGQVVHTVPAAAVGRGATRYVRMNRKGMQPTFRIVSRGGGGRQAVLVPQQNGRVSVLQNYQQKMQAIRIPPGFTVRQSPDGRIFLCPAKTAAKSITSTQGVLSGDAKTLAAELVPYPENKDDKAELKEWDKAWQKAFKAKSKEGDLTPNMMIAHLRRIMLMKNHGLYDTFSKALADSKEKAAIVAASDDNSCDKFLDVVQTTVETLYSALLKHYS